VKKLPATFLRGRIRRSTLGLVASFFAVLTLWIAIRPAPPEVTEECDADRCVVTVRTTKKNPAPTVTPVPTAPPERTPRPTPTPTASPKPRKPTPTPGAPSTAPTAPASDVGGLLAPQPSATPTPTPAPERAPLPLPANR
jgi:hypothetical protein